MDGAARETSKAAQAKVQGCREIQGMLNRKRNAGEWGISDEVIVSGSGDGAKTKAETSVAIHSAGDSCRRCVSCAP